MLSLSFAETEDFMKTTMKAAFCVLLIGFAAITGYGQKKKNAERSLAYIGSGEYAYYLDKRGNTNCFRGYMHFVTEDGKDVIFVRNLNLKNGKDERFMFVVEDDENGHPLNIISLQGQCETLEARQALPDFFNFTTQYLGTRDDYDIQKLVDDEWENYVLIYNFNKTLPFFRFLDIKMKGSAKGSYNLQYGGLVDVDNPKQFFEMQPIVRKKEKSRRIPVIPGKAEKTITSNDVSITLDENWEYNNSTELPGYWLALKSVRDSQISIEKAGIQDFDPNNTEDAILFMKLVLLKASTSVEMNTVKVQKTLNGYQMEYYLWENNVRNYQRLTILPLRNMFYAVNFSSFADIYEKNKAYYENILNSILVNKL
jgi:hypothetical protein